MFQRLSNLLFGEVEEVAVELKGPNPCVTEADEEGWMIVNLSGKSHLKGGGGCGVPTVGFYTDRFRQWRIPALSCMSMRATFAVDM